MLALANKLSLNTRPIYRFVNEHSVDFDGVDDRIVTDNEVVQYEYATYSFWCKSSETGQNAGVFGHGGLTVGSFNFNYSSNKPSLFLNGSNFYRYWDDTSAQDDGEWHHWIVYVDTNDITNCKLYVDGVLQNPSTTVSTGSANPYTESLTIGSDQASGGNSFVGKIDEFAVYDRELTQAEITRMYNTYYSPNRVANGNFAQIGNEEVTNGDFSQIGSEEVTNGDFATDSDWTFYNADADTNTRFENNSAILEVFNTQFTRFISTTSPMTLDKFYKITYEVTETDNTDLNIQYPNTSLNSSIGTHTVYIKATNVNIGFSKNNVGKITIDNISVKEVGIDWNFNAGWSTDGTKAISDTGSGYVNINQTTSIAINKSYKVSFTISDYSSGNVQFIIGNSGSRPTGVLRSANGTYTEYITVDSSTVDADKFFIRGGASGFTGSIDDISVKEVAQHWTVGTGWSVEDNQLVSVAGTAAYTSQSGVGVVGRTYKVIADVAEVTAGLTYVYTGQGGTYYTINSAGVYTFSVVWDSISSLGIYKNASFAGKYNSITIQELKHDATNLMLNAGDYQSANPLITSTKSMEFDGTDDKLVFETPSAFSGLGLNSFDCTLSAWAKFDTIAQYEAIVCLGTFDLEIAPLNATDVGIWVDNSGLSTTYTPTMGKWNHYVATKSGNTYSLYVDGVLIGSDTDSDNATIGTQSFIGNNGASAYFDGQITEVGIYDRCLTSLEVASLYNQGMPTNLLVNRNNYQSGNPTVFNTKQVDFDGTDDYLKVTNAYGSFTGSISAWVKRDGNLSYQFITDFRDNSGTGFFYFDENSDTLVASSGTIYVDGVAASTLSTDGNWHQAVVTGITLDITQSIFIGQRHTDIFLLNGKLSQVGLWNSTLTADEVSSLYNHGLPIDLTTDQAAYASSSNLVGYWRMGSGTLDSYPLIADQTNATLSAEYAVNGDFSNGTTGWVAPTQDGAYQQLTADGLKMYAGTASGGSNLLSTSPTFNLSGTEGKVYKADIVCSDFVAPLGSSMFIRLNGAYDASNIISFGVGTSTIYFTAYQDFTFIKFFAGSFEQGFTLKSISIKEVGGNPAIMTNQTSSDIENGSPYANLVQNGTFESTDDWVAGSNITISGGSAIYNNAVPYNNLSQNSIFQTGKTYKIEFSVSNFSGGKLIVQESPNVNPPIQDVESNGNYSVTYTATTDSGIVFKVANGTVNMNLDNVTVEEVNTGLQGYWKMGDGTNDAYPTIYDQTSNTNNATMTNMVEGNITNQYPLTKIRNYYRMGDGIMDGYPIIQDQTSPNLAHIPTTNLFIYSEDFSQSNWQKDSGATLTSGQTSPIGDNTAFKLQFSGTNQYIQYPISGLDTTKDYTISFYAKVDSGTTTIDAGNMIAGSYEVLTVTDEWQRFEVTQTPSATTRYPRPIQSNGSDTVYLWGCQFEVQSQATAYIKSDGIAAVRKSSTTNLVPYSEDFSEWNLIRATLGAKITSPFGTDNANSLIASTANDDHFVTKNISVVNTNVYSFSAYLKKGSKSFARLWNTSIGYADFDLENGIVGTQSSVTGNIEFINNGWYRCSIVYTATSTSSDAHRIYTLDGDNDKTFAGDGSTINLYLWGAQLEEQTQAETYAKTTGLPVTISLFTQNSYGTMTNMSSSDIVEDTP